MAARFIRVLWASRRRPLDLQGRQTVEQLRPLASGVHVSKREPKA